MKAYVKKAMNNLQSFAMDKTMTLQDKAGGNGSDGAKQQIAPELAVNDALVEQNLIDAEEEK